MVVKGNKGGVGIRFNVHHSSVCFINCHLAAHMEEVDKRNQVDKIIVMHVYPVCDLLEYLYVNGSKILVQYLFTRAETDI